MLTDAEKRQLADIETSLRQTDPAFAEQLAQGWERGRRRERVSRIATVAALMMAVAGLGLAHLDLVVLSVTAIAVALVALGFALFVD